MSGCGLGMIETIQKESYYCCHGYLVLPVLSSTNDDVIGGTPVSGHYDGVVGLPLSHPVCWLEGLDDQGLPHRV